MVVDTERGARLHHRSLLACRIHFLAVLLDRPPAPIIIFGGGRKYPPRVTSLSPAAAGSRFPANNLFVQMSTRRMWFPHCDLLCSVAPVSS